MQDRESGKTMPERDSESSYLDAESIKWYNHLGKQAGTPQIIKCRIPIPYNDSPRYTPRKMRRSISHKTYIIVHPSIAYNVQSMGVCNAIQISVNR